MPAPTDLQIGRIVWDIKKHLPDLLAPRLVERMIDKWPNGLQAPPVKEPVQTDNRYLDLERAIRSKMTLDTASDLIDNLINGNYRIAIQTLKKMGVLLKE